MQIKASEISRIIKDQIAGYSSDIDLKETGTVLSVGDGIARIYGLEKAMAGKTVGDEFEVTIEPADAYGERNEANVQRIPTKHFKDTSHLEVGQMVSLPYSRS